MNTYPINVFWNDEDKAWIADVPDLRGCSAHGATPAEAVEEVQVAIEGWLAVAKEAGKTIPQPGTTGGDNPIRFYREQVGMTQHELAKRSGLNQRVISRLELCQRTPRVDHLIALARALDDSPEKLYPSLDVAEVEH